MKELAIPCDVFLDIQKTYSEKGEKEEKWFVEGYAVTKDLDFAGDVITESAINGSVKDLKTNKTVLRNHNLNEEIGVVEDVKADSKGLFVKILISKTVPDIWKKVQEGVLNKFSVRLKVIEAFKKWDKKAQRLINHITKMKLVETSLVSIAMNENAKAVRWYVQKAIEKFENEGGVIEVQEKDESIEGIMGSINDTVETLKSLGMNENDISQKFIETFGIDITSEIENANNENDDSQDDDKSKDESKDKDENETENENTDTQQDKDSENDKEKDESTDNSDAGKDGENFDEQTTDKDEPAKGSGRKRQKTIKEYILEIVKNVVKDEMRNLLSKDKEAKKIITEQAQGTVSDDLKDIKAAIKETKEKLLNYDDYPQLKEQLEKLVNAFNDLAVRIDEVEKNVGFEFNSDSTDNENGDDEWKGLFPQAFQSKKN